MSLTESGGGGSSLLTMTQAPQGLPTIMEETLLPSALRTVPDRTQTKTRADFRPKTAIPQDLTAEEYAAQCIQAAIASRLSPYALHQKEYEVLRRHINHLQVTTYLHIRNGILRLWHRNPLVSVTREEAAGCAKDYRFFDVADVAYDWLVRNGYINFGCIEVPSTINSPQLLPVQRRKTIVVIGAGMAGLGCARQLEGLITQYGEKFSPKELPPRVVILEGRGRIGGRVYSHPLKNQSGSILPADKRATADLGAQVITGFDNGNPLGVLIRGQLALGYHSLKDNSVLHDSSGSPVDKYRDGLVERLFNDILDRVSIFKRKADLPKVIEGDKELIDHGKDPAGEGGKLIAEIEDNEVELPTLENTAPGIAISGQAPFTAGIDKLTGKPATATGSSASIPAAEQIIKLGWKLIPSASGMETITLAAKGDDPDYPTLGKTMDHVLEEYRKILNLTPQDLRLINWHYANLEYANATNVNNLSLGYWDQDDGQEFAGAHAMLKGGYTQVPRGLYLAPTPLDVKSRHVVKKVSYQRTPSDAQGACQVVVVTLPLGVLKAGSVEFDPPLPEWKTGAIERLGFGLLNKVVLVYDQPFWDVDNDMVGLLRDPSGDENLHQSYAANRGRFYMFWNVYKTSGKPVLVALMAGDAAHQTEVETDEHIISEATIALQAMYPNTTVPAPTETIITRWKSDPFSRGSYSYVGASATGEDYDLIAKPISNTLFFAGEATCKSHPATVHGAYISGLRAASELITTLLGDISVPTPLIPAKPKLDSAASAAYRTSSGSKRKAEDSAIERAAELKSSRLSEWESRLQSALVDALGERPVKPGRSGANPFLLYQKDHWFICKAKCDEARRTATGNSEAKATRNEVRAALGQMWREAPADEKKPYLDQTERNKEANAQGASEFKAKLKEWDGKAQRFREEWKKANPSVPSEEEVQAVREAQIERAEMKRSRKLNGYMEDSDEEEY
ncbi:hypothetical protein EX30DRAFT_358650 [Ascodesmis nigricans]|uniref:SWIRM domain-containing protein n=1 Tax=Ascodesmis nigricans TaxID=341454 RepID=A0A4S2MYV8_9PEZI|nr:hypothetical protein EX30DRAFT_358650 [Ascodesmis nigricans]